MSHINQDHFFISMIPGPRAEITVSESILETHVIKVSVDGKPIRRSKNKIWSFKMEVNKYRQISLSYSPRRRKMKGKNHEFI